MSTLPANCAESPLRSEKSCPALQEKHGNICGGWAMRGGPGRSGSARWQRAIMAQRSCPQRLKPTLWDGINVVPEGTTHKASWVAA